MWKSNCQKMIAIIHNFSERLKSVKYQILFVSIVILVSRLLMFAVYLFWQHRTGSPESFTEALFRFDASWYETIIKEGYFTEPALHDKGDAANWAFFPLFPILMRFFHEWTGMNLAMLGFLLNTFLFGVGLFLAFRYIIMEEARIAQAVLFVLFMGFGAYTFYFSAPYTESMFFLLLVGFFYALKQKRYLLMGVIGALASATRNLGVMLVFPVAIEYLDDFLHRDKKTVSSFMRGIFGNIRLLTGTLLIPLGLFLYMTYLKVLTGDGLAFVHIQRAWGKNTGENPIRVLLQSLIHVDSFVFYLSLWSIWGIYCVWLLLKNKRWAEASMAALLVFIPLSTGVDSIPRYLIGGFLPLLGFCHDSHNWTFDKKLLLLFFSIFWNAVCLLAWFDRAGFVM